MTGDAELLGQILVEHAPVLQLCGPGHLHHLGCTCGHDPLDLTEHVVNRIRAHGFVTLTAAAEIVQAELDAETQRLATRFHPNPRRSPLLGNWLGGIEVGVTLLQARAADHRPKAGDG